MPNKVTAFKRPDPVATPQSSQDAIAYTRQQNINQGTLAQPNDDPRRNYMLNLAGKAGLGAPGAFDAYQREMFAKRKDGEDLNNKMEADLKQRLIAKLRERSAQQQGY